MPTGYTSKLYDGKKQTFSQFAMDCARAFGAMLHMREDGSDIPYRPDTVSTYHTERLEECRKKKEWLLGLTVEQTIIEARNQYSEDIYHYLQMVDDRNAMRKRYEDMLTKVWEWEPPTPDHQNLKFFMIQQLQNSIEGDCNMTYITRPVLKTGEEWLKSKLDSVEQDIQYHTKEQAEEAERVNDRNEWVRQLQDSLPK